MVVTDILTLCRILKRQLKNRNNISPKIKEFEKSLINQFLSLLKKPPGKIKQSFQVSKKVAHTTSNWLPPHPRKLPRPHQLREHIPFPKLTILRDKRPPHPQLILRSVTSGTFRDFGKNDDEKNRFLFLYLRVEPKATFVD